MAVANNGAGTVSVLLNQTPIEDATPPIISEGALPGANGYGWNNTNVTINLNATDNPGGSGVKQIQFALSGAQNTGWQTAAENAASTTISTEGTTILSYFATDNEGNQEMVKRRTVRIDKTLPIVTCSVSPNILWPPNHKFVTVNASVNVMDTASGPAGFELVSVSSNEPATVIGSGNTTLDIRGFQVGKASTVQVTVPTIRRKEKGEGEENQREKKKERERRKRKERKKREVTGRVLRGAGSGCGLGPPISTIFPEPQARRI